MIYVFGNSHAQFFTDSTPSRPGFGENRNEHFVSYSLGPVIAYNFFEHHYPHMIQVMNELPITEKDYVMIAVGEVDCRWHLLAQADKQKRDVIELTYECIDRFFRAHLHLKENGYNVIAWGGHPSTKNTFGNVPEDPVWGDCLTRNRVSLAWNDYLEKKSKEADIPFVSIIRDLINVDGITKMEYYIDYCHLDSKKLLPSVTEKLRQRGLL
jgi:hypothetical protein